MKPQILVLSSSSNYIALNLEKDLRERPFSRLNSLEAYISSDRRSIPFLLIMEVANGEDLDRALIAYEWAETVDPRAPARYLILASKGVAFGERTAKLATVETAFLPVNNRNLVFKVDLQLKLLEAAVAALPPEGYGTDRPRTGFRAELASLPGRPGRVMVLRNPAQGKWQRDPVPGAKVRWRWIEEEGAGAATPPGAAASSGLSWAADSASEPEFQKDLGGYVLGGEDTDLKAFRKGEEIYSARNMIFTLSSDGEEEEPERHGAGAPDENAAQSPPGESSLGAAKPAAGPAPQKFGAEGAAGSPEVALKPTREEAKAAGPRAVKGNEAEGRPAPEKVAPLARGAPLKKAAGGVAAVLRAAQGGDEAPAREARASPPARAEEHKNYLSEEAHPALPGSISAAAAAHDAVDETEKARVEREGAASEHGPERLASAAEAAGPARRLGETFPEGRAEEVKALGARHEMPSGEPVPSQAPARLPAEEERQREEKFRASAFEPTLKLGAPSPGAGPQNIGAKESFSPATEALSLAAEQPAAPSGGETPRARQAAPAAGSAPTQPSDEKSGASSPNTEELARLGGARGSAKDGLRLSRARAENPEFQARILKAQAQAQAEEAEAHRVRAAGEGKELNRIAGQAAAAREEARLSGAGRAKEEGEPILERLSYQMTLTELGDQNSTWQPASTYRIYLSARHRYYGFRHETELFPLWVYQGELAPEFLETEKAWRFYDRRPEPFFTRAELPASLSAELFRLLPAANPAAEEALPGGKAVPAPVLWKTGGALSPPPPAARKPKGFFSSFLAFMRKLIGG